MRGFLHDLELTASCVLARASVAEASIALARSELSAVAVVDERERVVGLFTEDELLRSLFPAYLEHLHHTAAAPDDPAVLRRRAGEAAAAPVAEQMREPLTVELDSSMTHLAEVFLHCDATAVAVVADGRFRGMLSQTRFARYVVEELGLR